VGADKTIKTFRANCQYYIFCKFLSYMPGFGTQKTTFNIGGAQSFSPSLPKKTVFNVRPGQIAHPKGFDAGRHPEIIFVGGRHQPPSTAVYEDEGNARNGAKNRTFRRNAGGGATFFDTSPLGQFPGYDKGYDKYGYPLR
jgi:hypothetical protein